MEMSQFASSAVQAVAPVLLAALTWVAAKVAQLIQTRVRSEYLRGVLLRLDDAVLMAVREVSQVVVEGLKAANADGKLTAGERAAVKAQAIATIKSHLGMRGLKELGSVLGVDLGGVENVLSTRVEAAVHELKKTQTRVSNGVNHHENPGGDFAPPFGA